MQLTLTCLPSNTVTTTYLVPDGIGGTRDGSKINLHRGQQRGKPKGP